MSCILRIFGIKRGPPRSEKFSKKGQPSERYLVNISLTGHLPERDYELSILEEELVRRIGAAKKKSIVANKNAHYLYEKGDIRRSIQFLNERKALTEEIEKTSKRLMEVIEKRNELMYPPPLNLPPPKLENVTINPVKQIKDVANHSAR